MSYTCVRWGQHMQVRRPLGQNKKIKKNFFFIYNVYILFVIKLFILIKPKVKHFKSHWPLTPRPTGRKKKRSYVFTNMGCYTDKYQNHFHVRNYFSLQIHTAFNTDRNLTVVNTRYNHNCNRVLYFSFCLSPYPSFSYLLSLKTYRE